MPVGCFLACMLRADPSEPLPSRPGAGLQQVTAPWRCDPDTELLCGAVGWSPSQYVRQSFDENPMGNNDSWAKAGKALNDQPLAALSVPSQVFMRPDRRDHGQRACPKCSSSQRRQVPVRIPGQQPCWRAGSAFELAVCFAERISSCSKCSGSGTSVLGLAVLGGQWKVLQA